MHAILHILGIICLVVLGVAAVGVVGTFLLFAIPESNGENPFQ